MKKLLTLITIFATIMDVTIYLAVFTIIWMLMLHCLDLKEYPDFVKIALLVGAAGLSFRVGEKLSYLNELDEDEKNATRKS